MLCIVFKKGALEVDPFPLQDTQPVKPVPYDIIHMVKAPTAVDESC